MPQTRHGLPTMKSWDRGHHKQCGGEGSLPRDGCELGLDGWASPTPGLEPWAWSEVVGASRAVGKGCPPEGERTVGCTSVALTRNGGLWN